MVLSTKVFVIITVIVVSAVSTIVGIGLASNFINTTPKTTSSPVLTFNSVSLTPGFTQDPDAYSALNTEKIFFLT